MQAELAKRAADEAEKLAEEAVERIDPLEHKTLAELEEAEESSEFADSRILDSYRAKRLAEMKAATARNRFGELLPLSRADFVAEVTEASKSAWVVVFLHQEHVMDSKLLARLMSGLAAKHKATKFMAIRADSCIENYPDKNVPTLLLYHDGSLQSQIVTLAELGGQKVTAACVEWVLAKRGAVTTELEDDPREELLKGGRSGGGSGGGSGSAGGSSRFGMGRRFGRDSDDDDD